MIETQLVIILGWLDGLTRGAVDRANRRDLPTKFFDGVAGIPGDGSNPGASARVIFNVIR